MIRPLVSFVPRAALACAFALLLSTTAFAQKLLPFKVYVGRVANYEITKGVNTIQVSEGFMVTGTMPVSPTNTYKIKAGQALALLYTSKAPAGSIGPVWGDFPTGQFTKVIRKVDGQEVKMENYLGVGTRFELTFVSKGQDDALQISRMYKSKFNPPLPAADFERTHGIYLMNSADPEPARQVPAFAKDVNKVAGKKLTTYYLLNEIAADAFFTVEVDFTDVQPGSLSSAKAPNAASQTSASDAQRLRDERAASQKQATDDRADAKQQRDEERAASKEAKADARAEAAAERAKKRAEAAAARKLIP
jgi:hypothetical protein